MNPEIILRFVDVAENSYTALVVNGELIDAEFDDDYEAIVWLLKNKHGYEVIYE